MPNPRKKPSKSSGPGSADTQTSLDRAQAALLRKLPPQNLEAEQAVLGGIFLHSSLFHEVVDLLTPEDFYSPAHKALYSAFIDLYRKNTPVDLVTAADHLAAINQLEAVGGPVYLAELAEAVVSASNALFHAKIVRNKSLQRQLIEASTHIIADSFESADVESLLDRAEQTIFQISDAKSRSAYASSKDVVQRVFKDLEKRVERQTLVTGVPTDYTRFDEMTAGLQPSDLIIVAGRPSMGKTAFALNMGMRAAIRHQVPMAVFSLEMSTDQLMHRMLCTQGRVNLKRLRTGFLNDQDWANLYDAAEAISGAPVFIDDTPALSTLELRARCRRLKSEHNLGLVIVDYLQLMRASRDIDSREQEISDISRSLKALAKELNIPVVALSQLNRKVEDRTNKRPMLSDLRESGAIEQDADVIIFLYRDEFYNKKDDNPNKGVAEVIIGKQRNGPVGDVKLTFLKEFTAFEDLAETPYPSEYPVQT